MFKLYGKFDDPIVRSAINYIGSEKIDFIFMTLAVESNLKYLYELGIYDVPVLFKNDTFLGVLGTDIPDLPALKLVLDKWQDIT